MFYAAVTINAKYFLKILRVFVILMSISALTPAYTRSLPLTPAHSRTCWCTNIYGRMTKGFFLMYENAKIGLANKSCFTVAPTHSHNYHYSCTSNAVVMALFPITQRSSLSQCHTVTASRQRYLLSTPIDLGGYDVTWTPGKRKGVSLSKQVPAISLFNNTNLHTFLRSIFPSTTSALKWKYIGIYYQCSQFLQLPYFWKSLTRATAGGGDETEQLWGR